MQIFAVNNRQRYSSVATGGAGNCLIFSKLKTNNSVRYRLKSH